VKIREQAYNSEDLLQALLAKYPDLLAGDPACGPGALRRFPGPLHRLAVR
jgi:hypothetical protein